MLTASLATSCVDLPTAIRTSDDGRLDGDGARLVLDERGARLRLRRALASLAAEAEASRMAAISFLFDSTR